MRLPDFLRRKLLDRLVIKVARRRAPDVVIGGEEDPYLRRWWVIPRNRWFNLYLHQFCRSDDDRAFHDHPWWSMSVILHGGYWEHMQGEEGPVWRQPGHVGWRAASALHRVQLDWIGFAEGDDPLAPPGSERPAWTLFITGPKVREWGFMCSNGWRHWKTFTSEDGKTVGRGCD